MVEASPRGRHLKGKGKGVLGAPTVSLGPKTPFPQTPFPFPFKTPATQAIGEANGKSSTFTVKYHNLLHTHRLCGCPFIFVILYKVDVRRSIRLSLSLITLVFRGQKCYFEIDALSLYFEDVKFTVSDNKHIGSFSTRNQSTSHSKQS